MNILDIAIAKKLAGGGGGSGTDNYNDLSNLPKINDTTLSGNKSSSALGLQSEINSDSKLSSDLVDDENKTNKFVTSTEKQTWNSKQNAIDADHKINADYVDDSTSTNKFVTADNKETWNAKQNAIDSSHKLSSDLVDDANHTNKFVTSTEKQTWNNKQNAIDSYHKLSSSLVSFTTAEAAALASGIDSSKVGQISTNQTNILLVENNSYKTDNLTDNIVRLVENKDGYAYITSTAGDVIKSVGKNLVNPANYDYTAGSGNITCVSAADGSVTLSSTEGYKWTSNSNLSGSNKLAITKPGTFYFVLEHISGYMYAANKPTTPVIVGHQTALYDASGAVISGSTAYSQVTITADFQTVLKTVEITSEMIQAGAAYLQIRIWSNGTTDGGRYIDNFKFRVAGYFDDSSITDATPYQPYKESIETCDASGHCYIMTYEDGSVYSQNDYLTKTITVDYPESDFAVRFNESEKATDGIDKSDVNYIEMKSGQRVYADTEEPYGNIEVGSIGVGFDNGLREFGVGAKKSATTFPVTFGTDGTPITDYTIYGNTGGVGDRSVNYVDRMNIDSVNLYPNQTTGTVESASGSYSIIIPVSSLTDCFFSINRETTAWNRCRLAGYATYPEVGTTATFVDNTTGTTATDDTSGDYTYNSNNEIPAGTNYIMVFLASNVSTLSTVDVFREAVKASKPMLTSGIEKLPYVKYYSIPVSCSGVVSQISLDSPLAADETVTYEDSGSPIYTVDGQNTMTFDSTISPSEIDFEYVGWHPTGEIADLTARVEALENA